MESWVVAHRDMVQKLLYAIEEYEMKDTYGGLNYKFIRQIISDSYKEINRLEGIVKLKENEIQNLKDEYNKLYNKIFQSDENIEQETPQAQDGNFEENQKLSENKKVKHSWARKK